MFTTETSPPMGVGSCRITHDWLIGRDELSAVMYRRILGLVVLVCLPAGWRVGNLVRSRLVLLGPQWGFPQAS